MERRFFNQLFLHILSSSADPVIVSSNSHGIFFSGTGLTGNFFNQASVAADLGEAILIEGRVGGSFTNTGDLFTGGVSRSGILTMTAVPEPAAFGLLAGLLALVSCLARRKRRSQSV
ncbi:MAG: PEP-CTERM sorting domain-containing protein [Opitutales bacterium]